jgi:hypothetical protein
MRSRTTEAARGGPRRLPAEPAPDRLPGTDFIVPVEHVDPDEEAIFDRVIGFMLGSLERSYEPGSGDRIPEVFEEGQGLTTCLLRGELTVTDRDLAAVPEMLRVGLLATPGTYPLIGRFNVIDTTRGFVMSPRLSVKIDLGSREMDLLTAGFAPAPCPNFFLRDATDLDLLAGAPRSLLSPRGLATAYRIKVRNLRPLNAYVKRTITQGPFGTRYTSALPYRLGPAAAKWLLDPEQEHPIPAPPDERFAAHQARCVAAWFADGGREVSFRLSVQVATVAGTTGPIACVEDSERRWDDERCPVFTFGRLRFPAATLDAILEDFGPPAAWAHRLRFENGNTLPEHAPLGQSNRLRMRLYREHSDLRRAHLHGVDGPTMPTPFA